MREIHRIIACAVIFSKDGKMLLGRKDPAKGGVYPDCWHIPGGGVDEGESLLDAAKREVLEETGIDAAGYPIIESSFVNSGEAEVMRDGEKVLIKMEFYRFEIRITDKNADEIKVTEADDLINFDWFDRDQLLTMKHTPGAKEFFEQAGYIDRV